MGAKRKFSPATMSVRVAHAPRRFVRPTTRNVANAGCSCERTAGRTLGCRNISPWSFQSAENDFLVRKVRTLAAQSSGNLAQDGNSSYQRKLEMQIVRISAVIMFSCMMLRVNFSAAAPTIAADFGLSMVQLAYIHSSFLAGYLLGHIPAGVLADRVGGAKVLSIGATAWATATFLHAGLAITPRELAPLVLAFLRFCVGFTTAVAVPGLAATLAQALPEQRRSHAMSTCYGWFNIGSVVGLAVMPLLSSFMAWPDAFAVFGVLGALIGIVAWIQVTQGGNSVNHEIPSRSESEKESMSEEPKKQWLNFKEIREYMALIWAHSVIGWGFFMFQNWIPTYLQHMNVTDPVSRGLLSALPWVAPVCTTFVFRSGFEHLRKQGVSAFKSQSIAHAVACLGAAAALVPVALSSTVSPYIGLLCIGLALALQTANYSGFHSYVQYCYADRAGVLLGVTNSFGIITGIVANLAMGWCLNITQSYTPMFAATVVMYFSSWLVWVLSLHGDKSATES